MRETKWRLQPLQWRPIFSGESYTSNISRLSSRVASRCWMKNWAKVQRGNWEPFIETGGCWSELVRMHLPVCVSFFLSSLSKLQLCVCTTKCTITPAAWVWLFCAQYLLYKYFFSIASLVTVEVFLYVACSLYIVQGNFLQTLMQSADMSSFQSNIKMKRDSGDIRQWKLI